MFKWPLQFFKLHDTHKRMSIWIKFPILTDDLQMAKVICIATWTYFSADDQHCMHINMINNGMTSQSTTPDSTSSTFSDLADCPINDFNMAPYQVYTNILFVPL